MGLWLSPLHRVPAVVPAVVPVLFILQTVPRKTLLLTAMFHFCLA